ncbi:MAG: hypothetical protein ACC628_06700 [Pirellulaceae bacterium]
MFTIHQEWDYTECGLHKLADEELKASRFVAVLVDHMLNWITFLFEFVGID